MLLRHDDPLVKPLQQLGEPVFLLDSNPTVERIAEAHFRPGDRARSAGRTRHRLGNAHVIRRLSRACFLTPVPESPSPLTQDRFRLIVFDLDGTLVDSRRDIADAANAVLESCGALRLPEERIGRMVGDGAASADRSRVCRERHRATGRRARSFSRDLSAAPARAYAAVPGRRGGPGGPWIASDARRAHQQAAPSDS